MISILGDILKKINLNLNYWIIRYNYELNSIDDTTISLTSTLITTFTWSAIVDILTFELTIKYNY